MKIIMIFRKISQTNNKNKKTKIRHNHTKKKKKTKNLCDSSLGLCPRVVDNGIIVSKKDYKVFTKLRAHK